MNQPVQPNDVFPNGMVGKAIEGRKQRTIEEILRALDEEQLNSSNFKGSAESNPAEFLQVIASLRRLWHSGS